MTSKRTKSDFENDLYIDTATKATIYKLQQITSLSRPHKALLDSHGLKNKQENNRIIF